MTNVNIIPETMSPTMKMGLNVDAITVRGRITISLAEISQEVSQKTAKVIVIDESGSTTMRDYAMSNGQLIFPVEVNAAKEIVYQMGDDDLLGIVAFDNCARTIVPLTKCDAGGRDQIMMALDRLTPNNGSTAYTGGLQLAYDMLKQAPAGYNRSIDFLSDGGCNPGDNPLPLAEQIRKDGIMVYTAGIQDQMQAADEDRLKQMSGGANFKACLTAEAVTSFLAGALKKAKKAALTNISLRFMAIGLVDSITALDLVTKNGKRNYVAGTVNQKTSASPANGSVTLGELGADEKIEVYLEFKLKPPQFKDGINFQKRTFGELLVTSACPSEGINEPKETGKTEMFQNFARTTSGTTNPEVEKLSAEWTAASALAQAANTTNPAEQQDILSKAAAKVRRATQVFTDDDGLAGALSDLETLHTESRTKGAAAAGKSAGRKTAVFVEED